jgi:cytochrome c oxidase assembly protein subunit 15
LNQDKEIRTRDAPQRLARIRRVALWCAAVLLAVTSLSAFIRLSNAGLGCADWPGCYGENLRAAQAAVGAAPAAASGVALARIAHRVLGGAALVLALVLVMGCFFTKPVRAREGAAALGLLALALLLALLGRFTAGARVPAVTIGNLLGGFGMLAIAWRLAVPMPFAMPPRVRVGAALGATLVLLQVVLGGQVSAGYAGLSCPSLLHCLPDAPAWHALDPFREPVFDASTPMNPAGAAAQAVHRVGAMLVVAVLVPLAAAVWRAGARRAAAGLLLLLGLQVGLGIAMVLSGLPLAPALLHNAVAALLFAATVRIA